MRGKQRGKNYSGNVIAQKRYKDQKGKCFLCDRDLDLKNCTKEHVYPTSINGARGWQNCALTHGECNSKKANLPPTKKEIEKFNNLFGFYPKKRKRGINV